MTKTQLKNYEDGHLNNNNKHSTSDEKYTTHLLSPLQESCLGVSKTYYMNVYHQSHRKNDYTIGDISTYPAEHFALSLPPWHFVYLKSQYLDYISSSLMVFFLTKGLPERSISS